MKPIRRERLHDTISKHLALAILRGETDSWSSENDLCRKLEVSRSVLRESIKVLASKGLLEVRPKIGIRVLPRSEWNLFDPELLAWQFEAGVDDQLLRSLVEVQLIVETAAAGLAAVHATHEEILSIKDSYQEMERHADNKEAYDAADFNFHASVFSACRNPLLIRMIRTLRNGLASTVTALKVPSKMLTEASLPLHMSLVDALAERSPALARAATEKLILEAAQKIYDVLHPDEPHGWDAITWGGVERDTPFELVPS